MGGSLLQLDWRFVAYERPWFVGVNFAGCEELCDFSKPSIIHLCRVAYDAKDKRTIETRDS